jgi:hypothetical protein
MQLAKLPLMQLVAQWPLTLLLHLLSPLSKFGLSNR